MTKALRGAWCVLVGVCVALGARSAVAADRPRPEKGKPFAAEGNTPPYEAVLDHCDVVLVGKVTGLQEAESKEVEGVIQGTRGKIELAVEKVLRGEWPDRKATITFDGKGPWGLEDREKARAFLCIRTKDGALVLAGDPPEGGGFVREGPALVEKLLAAAKDPKKGYESADAAVKLSSAYRLAMEWLAAPADRKPAPPPNLINTLIDGLMPDDEWRGRNVNAAARDAFNQLLDCNITVMWTYSVYHGSGKRENAVPRVKDAWERTVKAVQERRKAPAGKPDPYKEIERKRAAKLLEQLASKDENERLAAGRELADLSDIGLETLGTGTRSTVPGVAEICRKLRREVIERRAQADPWGATFDPEKAEPFVPAEKPSTASGPAPSEPK